MNDVWIDTSYGRMYGRAAGRAGDPLVLAVHGLSRRNGWQTWEPLLRPLADGGYYAVSLDMPGWGRSTATAFDPMNTADGAGVLAAAVAKLGYEQAHAIMGKSWGGALALTLALEQRRRVAKLILTAPAFMQFDRLPDVQQPILLVWAEDDPTIPVATADRYAALPDVTQVIYKTGGHSAAPKNAGDFAPRALAFLDKQSLE
jgi:pimeloyl-ACP methyl ester carboxylesterase